ncbi:BglG family transcription antiterminator [Chakrabartyella piscis]|uniref:BglG family transcription antiterminator n=1 Tax=Chakrabartyella piscis TaxID=2918914 RepID=UPI00295859E4|nr:PTS sugar transporter subunit IIA [Chakrabartyella piscis]
MFLFDRQVEILNYLKEKGDFVTGSAIAKHLKISDRTVRNEIHSIKKTCGENIILAVKTKGYMYNKEFDQMSTYHNLDIVSPNDRLMYILKNLVISNSNIDIFDIAERLYVSERSVEADVTRINKILLELDLQSIGISRTDTLIQLKNAYGVSNNLLYDVAKFNSADLNHSDFQKIFPNINIDYLGSLVIEILNHYKYASRYLSYTRFIVDIAMLIEAQHDYRHSLGVFYEDLIAPFKDNYTEYYSNIASDIHEMVLGKFGIQLSQADTDYMTHILYITHKMDVLETEIADAYGEKDEFSDFCHSTFEQLRVQKGIPYIENINELADDLILHLRIAMMRTELGIKLYNPLIHNVTTEYMHLIDVAIMIADRIEETYGVHFTFNEISYIGIYLATALHNYSDTLDWDSKLKILLYIPEGIGNLNLINKQIERIVDPHKVAIDGITNLPSDSEFDSIVLQYHLVITTSKRFSNNAKNIFILKKSFDINYQNQIKEIINKELIILKNTKLNLLIRKFTNEKLFVANLALHTKNDVISHLSNMLCTYGVVGEDFKEYVFAREKIAGTDLETGIAFPHSLKNIATHSAMAICTLKDPILWNTKKVNVVCMYANSLENSSESVLFVQHFMGAIFAPEFVESLKKCTTYDECVATLVEKLQ